MYFLYVCIYIHIYPSTSHPLLDLIMLVLCKLLKQPDWSIFASIIFLWLTARIILLKEIDHFTPVLRSPQCLPMSE